MNKKKIVIVIISFIIFISIILFAIIFNKRRSLTPGEGSNLKVDTLAQEEITSLNEYRLGVYEVVSRDDNGEPLGYRLTGSREEEPIELEIMDDLEKAKIGAPMGEKIQVLQRDSSGNVSSYRLIKDDSDIVTKY